MQNRVDAVVQLTSSKVSDHHGYSADAVSFELQKLALTILGALPENILRGNLEVYDALSNVAFHDYSHGGWDDKYSKALQLSEAYATFKGLVNKNQ